MYKVLEFNPETGNYRIVKKNLTRYAAAGLAERLRSNLNDPFEGTGNDLIVIAEH